MHRISHMLDSIFGAGRELAAYQMAARAFVLFFITLGLVRLAGMRAFGHKSAFDAIIVIMLGAVLSRAIVGVSPFWPTVAAAAVLAAVHRVLSIIGVRFPRIDGVIKGSVAVIYENGALDRRAMLRFGIDRHDIDAAVRHHGFARLADVASVYKEADGTLSVINYSPRTPRSLPARPADRQA